MHRQDIINTYERIEEAAGGIRKADSLKTLDDTVKALNMDRQAVLRVMIDHWFSSGAG